MILGASVYIHIPFCVSKCDYCDFFSVPCGVRAVPDEYVSALCNELRFRLGGLARPEISTIYIGGGTPSLLSPRQLQAISGVLREFSVTEPEEWTVEVNPDDVSEDLLLSLADVGVNRISCGVQAFEEPVLSAVRRRSSASQVQEALSLIKKRWRGVFSADIISALPNQTERGFLEGLSCLLEYGPQHVSLYSLSVEEGTPLFARIDSGALSYDFQAADALWLKGKAFLEDSGFRWYEVSNFARPGFECRHNMTYWRLADYVGTGSGGTGTRYGTPSVRFTNTCDIDAYCRFWNGEKPCEERIPGVREELSAEDERFEFFMMGLRTADGISLAEFERRFFSSPDSRVRTIMDEWVSDGRAEYERRASDLRFRLSDGGRLFLNDFLRGIL